MSVLDGSAVALGAAESNLPRGHYFWAREVVFEQGELGLGLCGVPDDVPVLGDERDPAGKDFAKPIGFAIEIRAGEGRRL